MRISNHRGRGRSSRSRCSAPANFLDSRRRYANPNNPTVATRNQLFVGVQANTFGQQEGPVAMLICEWMQQCAGVNGRFVDQQGDYSITPARSTASFQPSTSAVVWSRSAGRGEADAAGDKLYKGIAEVLEAMNMMYGADIWGDVPYREARSDSHDADVRSTDADLCRSADAARQGDRRPHGAGGRARARSISIYGGDKTKWIEAAHTLKARIYLHRVEKLGNGEYTKALAEAKLGIRRPANDWLTEHSTANVERNMWEQFQTTSFGKISSPAPMLVEIMKAQNDPRLPDYFAPWIRTADTSGSTSHAGNGGQGRSRRPRRGNARTTDAFRQPIITYDENQLIIAEAAFQHR